MEFREPQVLSGVNACAPVSVVRFEVDLSRYGKLNKGTPGPKLARALRGSLPELAEDPDCGEPLEELLETDPRVGIGLAVARAALPLLRRVQKGTPVAYAHARKVDDTLEIAVEYEWPEITVHAVAVAAAMVHELMPGNVRAKARKPPFKFDAELEKLKTFADQTGMVRQRAEIARAAARRGIPWRRFQRKPDLLWFGQGKFFQRCDLTTTTKTSAMCTRVTANKPLANRVLREQGLPAPAQYRCQDAAGVVKAQQAIGGPVVTKPWRGNRGRGVSVDLSTPQELQKGFRHAAQIATPVLVETYLPGEDYRFLVMNGELVACIKRIPPSVVGDGKSTIAELIRKSNQSRFRPDGHPRTLRVYKLDDMANTTLAKQGLSGSSVPEEGKRAYLSYVGNGGTTKDFTKVVHPDNVAAAIKAVQLMGIDVAGVDFLLPDPAKSYKETGGGICEVNYMPDLLVHIIAEDGEHFDPMTRYMEHLFPGGAKVRVDTAFVLSAGGTDEEAAAVASCLEAALERAGADVGLVHPAGLRSTGWDYPGSRPSFDMAATRTFRDASIDTAVIQGTLAEASAHGLQTPGLETALVLGEPGTQLQASLRAQALAAALSPVVDGAAPDVEAQLAAAGDRSRVVLVLEDVQSEAASAHVEAGGRVVGWTDEAVTHRWRAGVETLVDVARTGRPPRVAALCAALALGLGRGTSAFAQLWPAS